MNTFHSPLMMPALMLTLLLVLAEPSAGQELIDNQTFDSDIAGWVQLPPPSALDTSSWDGTQGLPPGSMKLTGDNTVIPDGCFATEESTLRVQADGLRIPDSESMACTVTIAFFPSADCTGGFIELVSHIGSVVIINEWETVEIEIPQVTDFPAFTVGLSILGGTSPDSACFFDNVSVTQTPNAISPTADIPTTGELGLALLVGLLALAGAWVLRSRGS